MLQNLNQLNWVAIVLAFLGYFILGYVWFTILFAKLYRISLGKDNELQKPLAMLFVLGPAICMLFITITTAVLFSALQVRQPIDAFIWGSLVGIGYLSANTVNIAINPNIPKPILYGAISSGYHFVGVNIVSFLLIQRF
ncbi:DUF1761 domain-containing protein [Leptospira mtsangambouensis]|uniref:DUF1761 domain-containing protein n=1 Tax=Leptospira mtsangambouensis TaxID=2484912 RepID=A0ABY2NZY8_9LEPT|nr:DUF1761 domain-containing protein [Leptospira mtsangambouensis]TGM74415.1 DUF1761 domain-containing protein [Leptospira mtsangambouensis]